MISKSSTLGLLLNAAFLLTKEIQVHSVTPMPSDAWPTSRGTVVFDKPKEVLPGTIFDGGFKTYELANVTCKGQVEGGAGTAVFIVRPGATLRNVIIGKGQTEGVHCEENDCHIESVFWSLVCEDALTIKGGNANSVTRVLGGGARNAKDKIIQHNGPGTVIIEGFLAQNFSKLYRSCGNCKDQYTRHVSLTNIRAIKPKISIATVNSNFKDQATLRNIIIESGKGVPACQYTEGTRSGEPKLIGSGPFGTVCNYRLADIKYE